MESKTFLDFLPTNFRHEKSFFIQNNLTDFEKLSNLSDLDINEIQRKSSLCTWNNLKKIRAIAIFKKEIGISRARLSILKAEWAYLNRPDRLTELVDLNFDRLQLVPLRASNFLEVDEINFLNDPDLPEVVSLPVSLTMRASSHD